MATKSTKPSKAAPKTDKDELLGYYREMLLIRRFEEKAGQLYGMGQIAGFCHLYIGQEAVVTGCRAAMKDGDQMITGYRDHAHMLACGMESRGIMAELTGRIGGLSRGKGGSMHMFSTEKHFYGGHGIVGAQVPIGAGLGFANKYLDNGSVETELYKRGQSFGIEGHQVDGMDVLEVRDAAKMAIDHARAGKGPMVLEMKTYRYRGHSMSDPAKYRTRDEVNEVRGERDPIDQVKAMLLKKKWTDLDALKAMDKEIKEIVADAAEFAQTSPEPEAFELYTDVLLEG